MVDLDEEAVGVCAGEAQGQRVKAGADDQHLTRSRSQRRPDLVVDEPLPQHDMRRVRAEPVAEPVAEALNVP